MSRGLLQDIVARGLVCRCMETLPLGTASEMTKPTKYTSQCVGKKAVFVWSHGLLAYLGLFGGDDLLHP